MVSFLDLPSDVHFIIWSILSLSDLAILQRVCHTIASRINDDKSLWIDILHSYVLRKRIPLPPNPLPLHRVAAVDVKSWVKHAFLLQKNYQSATVKSFRTCTYEGITWTKIIRGRWCLVASANLSNAKLAVWDLSQTNFEGPCMVMPLEGPITDGIVEDSGDYVHAAVTVATSAPFILILDLVKIDDQVCIKQLKKLTGASHVRLLRDEYVGFAVKDGADEYPHIANWKTGQFMSLRFPTEDKSSIQPESITAESPLLQQRIRPESCCAMGVWKSYLIIILLTRMHIFRIVDLKPDGDGGHVNLEDISWLTCLALPYFTSQAFFSDLTGTLDEENLRLGSPSLQITLRANEYLIPVVLSCSVTDVQERISFVLHDIDSPVCPKRRGTEAARFVVGTGLRTILWVGFVELTHARSNASLYLSDLTLDSHFTHMSEEEQANFAIANEPELNPRKVGVPLLHTLSSCDFDDGRGLAVLCSITGELCVLDFAEHGVFSSTSIQEDIPCSTQLPTYAEEEGSDQLDLPAYYFLKDGQAEQKTTPEIAAVGNQLWKDPFPVRRQIPGWSDDWSNFKGVCLWLASWPRWGPHDFLHEPAASPSTRVRNRLTILGDIIPVLYNEENQGRVIFRSGEQMYITKYEGDTDDDWDFDEFQSEDIFGILPFTYSEFLDLDVNHLVSTITNRDVQTNLVNWYGIDALIISQYQLSRNAFRIRSYYYKKDGYAPDLRMMELWSNEEWEEHGRKASEAIRGHYLNGYYNSINRLSWLQK